MSYKSDFIDVINLEIEQLRLLSERVGDHIEEVINLILSSNGKLIISGIGKSGHVGKKIAATLASTGTPSFFVHPSEAYHGDLGMIEKKDVVILISYSGETNELLKLIPFLRKNGNPVIAFTGEFESTLSKNSDYTISIKVDQEACAIGLAPTSSTTATMVVGDALAVTLMKARNFKEEDFAEFHPGGSLGRKLLTRVGDLMRTDQLPFIAASASMQELVVKITEGKLGLVIVGDQKNVKGVVTDGDLRRAFLKDDFLSLQPQDIMTTSPIVIDREEKIVDVESVMLNKKISTVLVKDSEKVCGVYQIYDSIK